MDNMKLVIERAKGHIANKTWSVDYAKGYCAGTLDTSIENNEQYDEYANEIDYLE